MILPDSVADLNHTPILEWYEVFCGSKNGYQKDMCWNESELHAEYDIHSRLNNHLGDIYDQLKSTRMFTLIIIWALKITRKVANLDLDLLTIFY